MNKSDPKSLINTRDILTDEELADALCGNNIHPIITSVRMFYNPQTGKFDKSYLMQFLNNMDKDDTGEAKKYWSFIERMVKNNMLEQKYQVLLANAVSVNDIDIKYSFEVSASFSSSLLKLL